MTTVVQQLFTALGRVDSTFPRVEGSLCDSLYALISSHGLNRYNISSLGRVHELQLRPDPASLFRCTPLIHSLSKMARLPWVAQIRNSRNNAEQIEVLRALKNEIVGHPPQKELVVTLGVLEPIIRLTFNKNGTRQDGKSHDHSFASRPLGEEEMVRLQCLQVIASIALGKS